MRKLMVLLLSTLFLCSCAKTIRPKRVSETAYPPEEALPLLEQLEEPFLTLPLEGTIPGEQLLEYQESSALFDERHRASIVRSVIDTDPEIEDFVIEADAVYEILPEMRYPTVYHKGIEVTEAVIRTTTYKKEYSYLDTEQLIVTQSYTGEEPMLKDFERRYIFERDENGEWILEVCSGVIVYSFGDGYEIPLKESIP